MNKLRLLLSLVLMLAMIMSFGALAYADETPNGDECRTFTVDGEPEDVTATPITSDLVALNGGETYTYYYVEGLVELDHTLEINGECAIILMDDSSLEFTQADGIGLQINDGSGLGIFDCDSGSGALKATQEDTVLIISAENARLNLNGGNLYAAGTCIAAGGTSSVCLYGGSIETGESDRYAIFLQDMSCGEMSNVTINAGGHGIASDCDGFAMNSGSIEAAGIGVQNTVGFKMFGGEIMNCAIAVQNYGELYLGGTAVIQSNGVDDIYGNVDMIDGSSIIMEQPAEEGFKVGLFSESLGEDLTEIAIMSDATEADLDYFTYDMDGTELYIGDGVMYLGIVAEEPVTTASVFSSSTGLLIAGAVLIAVVVIVVIVLKKKPMN